MHRNDRTPVDESSVRRSGVPLLATLRFGLDVVVGHLRVMLHRNASIQGDDTRQHSHKLLSDIKTFGAPHVQAALHAFCHQCDALSILFPLLTSPDGGFDEF